MPLKRWPWWLLGCLVFRPARRNLSGSCEKTGMNQHESHAGSHQAQDPSGISSPPILGTPHPVGEAQFESATVGIPWPDLADFMGEGELLRLLVAVRRRSLRAARVAARRWVERHSIQVWRMGQARFFEREQVWRALLLDSEQSLENLKRLTRRF